ncbi:MAG: hypothetical protein V2I33_20460, partial [Kangiellaceae bacterium]|nr:hypothetical protein [Kangiellaceae bacterium]
PCGKIIENHYPLILVSVVRWIFNNRRYADILDVNASTFLEVIYLLFDLEAPNSILYGSEISHSFIIDKIAQH